MTVPTLADVKQAFPSIFHAAGELLPRLSRTTVDRDITLAATCAGLAMLWQSGVSLAAIPPGTPVLGAVSDEAGTALMGFISIYAGMNGLKAEVGPPGALTDAMTSYAADASQYAPAVSDVTRGVGLPAEYEPFVAATAAIKLVLAGEQMKLLPAVTGMRLVMYHAVAGCKTMPYPIPASNSAN